jgi:hypothetical protein
MKLCCLAYKSDKPDPYRMQIFKALHEQIRLQYRQKMKNEGYFIIETEMPIENRVVIGKIDAVFQSMGGEVIVVDYVSSTIPKMYKHLDAAISAGFCRHELDIDASARVVSRGGVETDLPDELIEDTWAMTMSEDFQDTLSLSDAELLEYANPASDICWYCANNECRWKPKS